MPVRHTIPLGIVIFLVLQYAYIFVTKNPSTALVRLDADKRMNHLSNHSQSGQNESLSYNYRI